MLSESHFKTYFELLYYISYHNIIINMYICIGGGGE